MARTRDPRTAAQLSKIQADSETTGSFSPASTQQAIVNTQQKKRSHEADSDNTAIIRSEQHAPVKKTKTTVNKTKRQL